VVAIAKAVVVRAMMLAATIPAFVVAAARLARRGDAVTL
jgi:hypothetical protein